MKKRIIKIAIPVVIFILSVFLFEIMLNRSTTQTTDTMKSATLPVIYFRSQDISYNPLFGYVSEMDISRMRDCVTPMEGGRTLHMVIDKGGRNITNIEYELRSIDGEHLIENGQVTDFTDADGAISFGLSFKDLIENKKEYSLGFILSLERGDKVRYYTTVIEDDNCKLHDKLAFVMDFNAKTFEKNEEIATYIESDGTGDDTNYNKVGIHSSFNQITWGDLDMEQVSRPNAYITDIGESTARIDIKYYACLRTEEAVSRYNVTETYRVRQGSERFYLLDYERTTSRIFYPEDEGVAGNTITLGITDENIDLHESEDGNVVAFVSEGALYVVNIPNNRISRVFSFFDDDNADIRSRHRDYDIKILHIDEMGNVLFAVSGYINRGNHEGEVGVQIMTYSGLYNNVAEESFVPYKGSHEMLQTSIDKLLKYSPESEIVYMYLEGDVYGLHMDTNSIETIIDNSSEADILTSDSQGMAVWQSGISKSAAGSIYLMNFENGNTREIKAGNDEYIEALGFMGEDLVYGIAKKSDIHRDKFSRPVFPIYSLKISSKTGEILKEYGKEGYFVTKVYMDSNMITMGRIRGGDGEFFDTSPDTIIYSEKTVNTRNKVEVVAVDKYKKIVRIALKGELKEKNLKIADPDFVIFEESKVAEVSTNNHRDVYYVFVGEQIAGQYIDEALAIQSAYDNNGVVIDSVGHVIWKKGNYLLKNQIMAITGKNAMEGEADIIPCIEAMLEHAGYPRKVGSLIDQGKDVSEIIESNIPNSKCLNLTGCDVNTLMYYLDKDIPVLGISNGEAILIVGYNEQNLVWMNPKEDGVYKVGINDSREFFEAGGNRFYTYMYTE